MGRSNIGVVVASMRGKGRGRWRIASGLLALAMLFPATAFSSRLVNATVGSRDRNSTLIVLQFDTSVALHLETANGRLYTLTGDAIDAREPFARGRGLVRQIAVQGGQVIVEATRYTHARLTSAGAGTYLLILQPAKEPPAQNAETAPAAQQPVSEPEQRAQQPTTSPEVTPEENEPSPFAEPSYNPLQQQVAPATMGMQSSVEPFLDNFEFVPIESVNLPTTVKFALEISQQGNRDRAIVLLESIRPDEPEYGWAQISLGRLMDQAGDVSTALDNYRLALEVRETEGVASVRIALAFQAMGNRDAAAAMWERVLDMNRNQVFVTPAEMPRAPVRRPPAQLAQRDTPEMSQPDSESAKDQLADEGSGEKVSGMRLSGLKQNSSIGKALSFLRFWPWAVGGLAFIAGLFFGLKYIQDKNRHHAEAFDLNKDLESMGLDLEMTDQSRAETASPRVAQMYADQQEGAEDAAVTVDDDSPEPESIELDDDGPVGFDDEPQEERQFDDEPLDDDGDEDALSEIKKAKIREMHADGSSVREIAESLGLGQDEVRMTIDLAESAG